MRGLLAALLVPVALAGTCADSATLDYPAGLTGLAPPGLDRTDIAGSASGNGIPISATPGFCADDPAIADFYRDNFFYATSSSICASIMNCGGPAGYRLCYCSVVTP